MATEEPEKARKNMKTVGRVKTRATGKTVNTRETVETVKTGETVKTRETGKTLETIDTVKSRETVDTIVTPSRSTQQLTQQIRLKTKLRKTKTRQ